MTLAQIDATSNRSKNSTYKASWRSQSAFYREPQTCGVQASLNQKQRLQQLFLPEGIAFDGNRFNRTAATAPFFKYLAPGAGAEERIVSETGIEPAEERRELLGVFRREELGGRSRRVTFRVSLRWQNLKTEANGRKPTKESENAKSLASCQLA